MQKVTLILTLILFLWVNTTNWYEYLEQIWNYKGKILKVVKDSPYKIVSSYSTTWDSLENLVKKVWWVAWINWSYFCPKDYSACNWKNTFNWDRISNWTISSKWNNTWPRYIFWYSKDNKPLIHKTSGNWVDSFEWIYNWISNFPLILKEGQSALNYYESKWLIDAKMKAKWYKNFICSTKKGDTYMWYIVDQTIYDMVDALKNIGCYNALNLDSWWSLSVYADGYKRWPWRDIMDAFVIVKDDKRISKLDSRVELITKTLTKYIYAKSNSWVVRNKLITQLEKISNKNLSYNTRYLVDNVIINLRNL